MRVALLTNFVAPYRVPLFQALAQRVGTLRIFVSTRMEANRDWPASWEDLDVVVQRTLTLGRTWRHPDGFSERVALHLPYDTRAELTRFRPDALITGEFGLRSLSALGYARREHCPALLWATVSERTEAGRGAVRHLLRRHLLRRVDGVIVNGESGARYIRRFGVPEDRIFRVQQPVAVSTFDAAPGTRAPGDAWTLLSVGQLTERKGLTLLLAAAARWADRHPHRRLRLVIAGMGPLRPALETARRPPNMELSLLSSLPYHEMPAVYARAGILAFPSLADEWGLVVNEALASGLPVLGSVHAQAVEELVQEGRTGWLFRPEQPEAFDRALERALDTPAGVLEGMRQAARARISTLTPESAADRIAAALRLVCPEPVMERR